MTATATRAPRLTVDLAQAYAQAILNSVYVTGSASWPQIMGDVEIACVADGLPEVKNWLAVRGALQALLDTGALTRDMTDLTDEVYTVDLPAEPEAAPEPDEVAAPAPAPQSAAQAVEALMSTLMSGGKSPEKAAELAADRVARFPSSYGVSTTAAGATVTIRPVDASTLADIKARLTASMPAAPAKTPAAPRAAAGSAPSVTVRLTLAAGNPKAGKRGWFAEVCLPAMRAWQGETLTRAEFVALFPARTGAQLADSWAYLIQEGFAVRV